MTLLSGYSTIPRAPAAFRRGMMCRTIDSSRIVFTSAQFSSARLETVGCCRAGSKAKTLFEPVAGHVHHEADFPFGRHRAVEHQGRCRRSSAASTRRRKRPVLAISRVVLCNTSSTIRKLLARSELPVSVTSTMASTSLGGLTSVAPQLNSTLAVTPCRAR